MMYLCRGLDQSRRAWQIGLAEVYLWENRLSINCMLDVIKPSHQIAVSIHLSRRQASLHSRSRLSR